MNASSPASVVVLTGASSGIGHATALELARRGARLVLASRNRATLEPVALACEALGAAVQAVPTDVTDAAAVEALARSAVDRFGHIDAWINNVGVGVVGLFDQTPLALHRRVIEANLLGHMSGAHVALRHFRERGRGTLINMVSLGGWVSTPYAAAYSASKFALRGFTEAIRAEMAHLPDVRVCAVYPTFVDTPGVGHGANQVGKRMRTPSPMVDPVRVARVVADLIDAPRPTVAVGAVAAPARLAHAVAPELCGRLGLRALEAAFERAEPVPVNEGNLFEPSVGTAIRGEGARRNPAALLGMIALAGLAAWAGVRATSRGSS